MKLRWSNERDYAEPFSANDVESFVENGIAALRVFRLATARRVHRGEVHRTEIWCGLPRLHVEIDGNWLNPGHVKRTSESGWQFLDSFQVVFDVNIASDIEQINVEDAAKIIRCRELWWSGVHDVYRWNQALDSIIDTVCDQLKDTAP